MRAAQPGIAEIPADAEQPEDGRAAGTVDPSVLAQRQQRRAQAAVLFNKLVSLWGPGVRGTLLLHMPDNTRLLWSTEGDVAAEVIAARIEGRKQ